MLRDLQQDMMHAITGKDAASAPLQIVSDVISREERLNIHRNHYQISLKQALADNFPVCVALVGEEFFKACMAPFIEGHPPTTRQLHSYGDALPSFLDVFPPVQQHVPWLGDVARVERAVAVCWHRDRHAPLESGLLARLAPEEAAALCLEVQPSIRLIDVPSAAISVWQSHREGDQDQQININTGPEYGLVWREGQQILMHQIAVAEYRFLQTLYAGKCLESAIESALSEDPAFAFVPALQAAFGRGDFYQFRISKSEPEQD